MEFEWDEAKRLLNKAKHGFDFVDAPQLSWDYAVLADVQVVDGEERELIYLPFYDRIMVIVCTVREPVYRIISVREATRRERQQFYDSIA